MEELDVMVKAAKKAGDLLLDMFPQRGRKVTFKGTHDPVTEADTASEGLIIKMLKEAFPDHGIVAEESGIQGSSERYFAIDPLDGTSNYSTGFPFWSVSIAYVENGVAKAGVVYNPNAREPELYHAVRGEGAFLNGSPISVSKIKKLNQAVLNYSGLEANTKFIRFIEELLLQVMKTRNLGSAAIEICYLACGRGTAYANPKLGEWDIAAAGLILEEAGGRITDLHGNKIKEGKGLASNGLVHDEILGILKKFY